MKSSKLKKIIKKALKYVVTPFALICSIIGLYSINSYAYVSDTYSHTLTYESVVHTGAQYKLTYSLNSPVSNDYLSHYVLLVNINSPYSTNSTYWFNLDLLDSNNNVIYDSAWDFSIINRPINNVLHLVRSGGNSNTTYSFSKIRFRYNEAFGDNVILNIDFVNQTELTTTYYLDTYVSEYQQQLAQLQEDYDTLEGQYDTLQGQYDTLEDNYNTLSNNYNTLENEYEQKQSEYDMLTNGQLGYLDYMDFVINNENVEFGNNGEIELNLNELIEYNLYSNNSLNLAYFTTSEVNPNYYPLKIEAYYNELPVNLFSMYFNGGTTGIIKVGYYYNSQFLMKQISFDNTGTAVDTYNTSLINYEIFNGISVEYIEYIEIQFNNADAIAGSINFNSNYNIAYSTGYTNGYNYGYNVSDNVNREKIDNARQEGYQNGYNTGNIEGYNRGYNEGSIQDISTNGFKTLITTILSYPVNMVKESLNFEFMGIHVASIVLFIVSLGIVAFVIKRFKD